MWRSSCDLAKSIASSYSFVYIYGVRPVKITYLALVVYGIYIKKTRFLQNQTSAALVHKLRFISLKVIYHGGRPMFAL